MWNRGRLKVYLDEFRAWGGLILAALSVVVFLGTLGSAQAAPLPRSFVEIFLESRPGQALATRMLEPRAAWNSMRPWNAPLPRPKPIWLRYARALGKMPSSRRLNRSLPPIANSCSKR